MKFTAILLTLALCITTARAQSPQTQSPQLPAKQPPAQQPPQQQPPPPVQENYYRLVPAQPPAQPPAAPPAPPAQPQLYQLVPAQPPAAPVQYMTTTAQPVQYTTAQPVQYATSTVALSTQSTGQHQIVLGPGPLSLSAAWVGERLAGLKKTHVWTVNHQVIRSAPMMQQGPAAPVTYQLTTVSQPPVQQTVQLVQQSPPAQQLYSVPRPSEDVPPPVVATPQSTRIPSPSSHPLLKLLGH